MSNLAPRLLLLATICAAIPAQALRYHVGLRVRAFESVFEKSVKDLEIRKRVCPTLEKAVTAFFAMRLNEVGKLLDGARHQLRGEKPDVAVAWADSISVYPTLRLLDAAAKALSFTARPLYRVDGDRPSDLVLRLSVVDAKGKGIGEPASFGIDALPLESKLPLSGVSEGDHRLRVELMRKGTVLARREQVLSFVRDLDSRLAKILPLADEEVTSTKSGTTRGLARLVRAVSRRRTLETDIFAARILRDLERLQNIDGPAIARSGDARLWLFTGRGATATRVFAPKGLDAEKKVPLVIAMHGAGGSENLFFDGYGAGKIVDLCRKRGWLLVAPRSAMFGRGSASSRILDELSKLFPVDRTRVFGVGHSMGSGQLMGQVSANPDLFRAVASLGGGGNVRADEALTDLPVFVAAGDRDFGLRMANGLDSTLRRIGVSGVKFRTYEATEHLGIVQVALDDVFSFFERSLDPAKK